MGKRALFITIFVCFMALPLVSCNTAPSQGHATPVPLVKEPNIYFSPLFFWQKDTQRWQIPIPLTEQNPGPTIQARNINHEFGFGSPLQSANLYDAAVASGQQILNDETTHMTSLGWQPLFQPTSTGTFPTYVLYETFRIASFYCFVEYTVSGLDQAQGSQTLDIYHT